MEEESMGKTCSGQTPKQENGRKRRRKEMKKTKKEKRRKNTRRGPQRGRGDEERPFALCYRLVGVRKRRTDGGGRRVNR